MRRIPLDAVTALLLVGLACSGGDDPAGVPPGPEAMILSPSAGGLYAAGDVIGIEIAGTLGDESLPESALAHWVVLHHDQHVHPFRPLEVGATADVAIPRVGHTDVDVFYRFYARAEAPDGRADTAFVDLHPRVVDLAFTTEPAGMYVAIDGQPVLTPVTVPSVVGAQRVLGVPANQPRDAVAYSFFAWSHGADELHVLTTPDVDSAFVATLGATGAANVPPTVALAAPTAGTVVTVGATVALEADATDADGTITRVRFYDGIAPLGEDVTAPYALEWTPTAVGPHALTARATDDDGAIRASTAVNVIVQGSGGGDVVAPVATLTAPVAGTLDLVGAVTLAATATDDIGVVAVDFEVDGLPLATVSAAPFETVLPSTAAFTTGAHVIRARARDAAGNASPWSSALVTFGGASDLPTGFVRTTWASGFSSILTSVAFAPDGRMFVTEQGGAVRIVKDGALLPRPFTSIPVEFAGEGGLLGVALHPDFASNGVLYTYHTVAGGAHNRIMRHVANGDVAVPAQSVPIVDLPQLSGAGKHNGGAMQFGPDGKLYVAVGDAGVGTNAPSLATPFGKILRFNADGSIPIDNPWYGQATGINRAIWAKGLRNPYTFAFRPGTGRMHINDVGEGTWEEINVGRAGADFGWPATEGATDQLQYDAPLFTYRHSASPTLFSGNAVAGAAFYDPPTPVFGEGYVGDYFFADYVAGWIYRMDVAEGTAYAFARTHGNVVNLAVGPDGALYVLVDGRIDRITKP